jgi:hemoglobin
MLTGHTPPHTLFLEHGGVMNGEEEERMSLYEDIGGRASIDAALDRFYPKILGDSRVSFLFEGTDMARLKRHSRAFLTTAFGGPDGYAGRNLRSAHAQAVQQGLNETLFEVFMGHFRATLEELAVPPASIAEMIAIAEGGRDEVLNR